MQQVDKPRLEIVRDHTDQVFDSAIWALAGVFLIFTAYTFVAHLDSELSSVSLVLSVIAIASVIGFHFLKKVPHKFNYLVKITPENAERQYRIALRMMRIVNLVMLVEFGVIIGLTYAETEHGIKVDEGLILIFVFVLGFLPLPYFLWQATKK